MKNTRIKSGHGFTLIELLTVIAIIGILAAIIIPTVGKIRDTAKGSVCASNLRQLASACLLYANENRGQLVPLKEVSTGIYWRVKIEPYIGSRRNGKSVLICPSDSVTEYPNSSATGEWPSSYGLNTASKFLSGGTLLEYNAGSQSKNVTVVKQPSRFIMISDIGRGTGSITDLSSWVENRTAASPSFGYARFPWDGNFDLDWSVWPRHGNKNKANVAFYDGHVASLDLIADLKDHPNGDPLCLFDNH